MTGYPLLRYEHPLCYCDSLADGRCDFCTGLRNQLPQDGDQVWIRGRRYVVEQVAQTSEAARAQGAADLLGVRRPKGRWSVTLSGARDVAAALDVIEPHLVCKREEAATLRAICQTYNGTAFPGSLDPERRERRMALIDKLRQLKRVHYE